MHKSHDIAGVADDVLIDSLIDYPLASRGRAEIASLLVTINRLCKAHGYGAVPQYAQMIEVIWRDPEKAAEFKKMFADRRAEIEAMEE